MNPMLPSAIADGRSSPPVQPRPADGPRRWAVRALAGVAAGGLMFVATACGGTSSATTTSTVAAGAVLRPPAIPLQGCTYVLNGAVPAGEPAGIQPGFRSFTPDQAAQSAIAHITAHGGTGLVDGFSLPSGVKLYAGPDSGSAPVATIPVDRSMLAGDPVLWTTGSGAHWIATFVACGGQHLYWVSVDQIGKADAATGAATASTITMLEAAAPYTQTGQASALPVKIVDGQIVWNAPAGPHALVPPARGQLLGF